jgi:hypothetical protein
MCDNQIIVLFNAENRDSPVCAKSGVLKLGFSPLFAPTIYDTINHPNHSNQKNHSSDNKKISPANRILFF